MTPKDHKQNTANRTLTCPVCSLALASTGKQFCCENNHQFDIARQGYVNLLQPQHKKSKEPGDNQEMVDARIRFLDGGYYEPLSDQLNAFICADMAAKAKQQTNYHIVDAGSGEGYYTHRLYESLLSCLQEQEPNQQSDDATAIAPHLVGFDISQRAVKASCRRDKRVQWLTATSSHIPIADHSQDAVLCLFSRIVPAEFSRVLNNEGILYVASTGQQHLIELREMLYKDVKQTAYNPTSALEDHFVPLDEQLNSTIRHTIDVCSPQAINDLLLMTPHYWRATESAKAAIQALPSISVTVDVNLKGYRVCP